MAGSRLLRAVAAVPFLFIAVWCARAMDVNKLKANQQPFEDSGVVEWEGGKITLIDHFYGVGWLDEIWRGASVTFSPSTLGFDSVSWWQMITFLTDIGPVYAIWILESYRVGSAFTPVYYPTLFSFGGQLLGIGPVAPIFYFLLLVTGPSGSDLARLSPKDRTVQHPSWLLLLLVLGLHTSEVFLMYFSSDLTARHYWTWAWQMSPLWIGIGSALSTAIIKPLFPKATLKSPALILAVLGLVSTGVCVYGRLFSPYSPSTLFIPLAEPQTGFVEHSRKALQSDFIGLFSSSHLWLLYSFFDLYSAGLLGANWVFNIALLPLIAAVAGPGTAFAFGYYQRERALLSAKKL
ncbi:hypothetical protein M426DRAFT_320604 [Hypoxylon sp. CI-4A]|nr:hypothetical protein M426DRAFT_320604 [Hypoxylon sp. CI-4A]